MRKIKVKVNILNNFIKNCHEKIKRNKDKREAVSLSKKIDIAHSLIINLMTYPLHKSHNRQVDDVHEDFIIMLIESIYWKGKDTARAKSTHKI